MMEREATMPSVAGMPIWFIRMGKKKVPMVAPILPHAAAKPAPVALNFTGNTSDGNVYVVRFGPAFIMVLKRMNPQKMRVRLFP